MSCQRTLLGFCGVGFGAFFAFFCLFGFFYIAGLLLSELIFWSAAVPVLVTESKCSLQILALL